MTPRLSPDTHLLLMRREPAQSPKGDVLITMGVNGASLVVEAFDLDGIVKIRTEIALELYDQDRVDRFTTQWRRRMDKKREPITKLHVVT